MKFILKKKYISENLTCSAKAKFLNSHESWKAVNRGSFELKAINDGLAKARYSLTRDNEWRSESSVDSLIQSSHPHLK